VTAPDPGPGDAQPTRPPSWQPVALGPYLDGTIQPVRPAEWWRSDGVGLLYPGLVHSVYGESESGKSLLMQHLAAQIISDPKNPRPVLYVDFESDPASVIERLRMFGAQPDDIARWFAYVRPEVDPDHAFSNRAAEQDAYGQLLATRWALVIIDGVGEALTVYGKSDIDNGEVRQWSRQLPQPLAERTGAPVVLIDHLGKNTETRGRHAIGAQAKLATISGAAYMVEPLAPIGRGLRGILAIRLTKDRPGWVKAHGGTWRKGDRSQVVALADIDATQRDDLTMVTIGPPDDHVGDPARPFRPTQLMEKVSQHVEEAPGTSRSQITAAVQGKAQAARAAIDLLQAEGYIKAALGPRNAQQYSSVRPYRQRDDPLSDRYIPQQPLPGGQ
jgi:hypothetical protein